MGDADDTSSALSTPAGRMPRIGINADSKEEAEASQTDTYGITTLKVFPGLNQTVHGRCTGDHNGDVKVVVEDRS